MYNLLQLNSMKVAELKEVAEKLVIENADKLKKQDLIYKILDVQALQSETAPASAPSPASTAEEPAQEMDANAQGAKGKRDRMRKPQPKQSEPSSDLFAASESAEPSSADAPVNNPTPQPESTTEQPRQLQGPAQGHDRSQQGRHEKRRFDQPQDRGQGQQQPSHPQGQHQQHQQHQHQGQGQQLQHQNVFRPDKSKRGQADEHGYNFDGIVLAEGVLEIMPDGFGFMRSSDFN